MEVDLSWWRGWSCIGKQTRLWIRAPGSPTQGRFYLFPSTDFVSVLLVLSYADRANIGCTKEAGALAKAAFYAIVEKSLAKYCFKRK